MTRLQYDHARADARYHCARAALERARLARHPQARIIRKLERRKDAALRTQAALALLLWERWGIF